MNTAPASRTDASAPSAHRVPGQHRRAVPAHELPHHTDLLAHPDPATVAGAAAVENLLRCWVREAGLPAPEDGATLRIELPASAAALLVPIHYWSPTGSHRFGLPQLVGAPSQSPPVDAVTLAALLARETTATEPRTDTLATSTSSPASASTSTSTSTSASTSVSAPDLVARVADSLRRTATFVTDRREHPDDGPDRFLSAEQSLLLGHPLHPTPKSREGLTDAEAALYSAECRGSFPLHWLAVDPSVLASDSAWTERGRLVPASHLTERLALDGSPSRPQLPDGHAILPVHPWQLREARQRPPIAALFDVGLLRDLGPLGSPWHPTSSLRTVHRTGAPAMLKLSLALRITNSRRENLRKELHRGLEVHRLLRAGLSTRWHSVHPDFDIVRDPAWLAVDTPGGDPLSGLDVVIRHNPFAPSDDVTCVAGLTALLPTAHAAPSATSAHPSHPAHPSYPAYPTHPVHPAHSVHLAHQTPSTPAPHSMHPTHATHPVHLSHALGSSARRLETAVGAPRSRLADIVTRLAARTGRPRGAVSAEWFLRYLEHVVRPVLWLDSEAGIALEAHQQNTLVLLDADGWPKGGRYRDNQGYYFRESHRAELDAQLPGIGLASDTFVPDQVADERFVYYLGINNLLGLIGAFGSQRLADEGLLLAAFRRFLTEAASGPARLRTALTDHLLDSPVLRCKANLLTRLRGLDELVGPVETQSVYVTIANPLHS